MKGLKVTNDILDISLNLAKICLTKRTKSSVNVNSVDYENFPNLAPSENSAGYQIINYPILDPYQSALGVMQVIVNLPINTRDIDDLCEDVAAAVSSALYNSTNRVTNECKILKFDNDFAIISRQCESLLSGRGKLSYLRN